ncbi:MAG: glycoside hydrolase family 125 protein [Candidatus Izemoplasmatales bacterium]|nr:glycoside hydrolase family 125 protein [bacterium]MDZ4197606.1 glycoside hydrolase family 125 protein [Candidatus Izemoplasmatales bacterium]
MKKISLAIVILIVLLGGVACNSTSTSVLTTQTVTTTSLSSSSQSTSLSTTTLSTTTLPSVTTTTSLPTTTNATTASTNSTMTTTATITTSTPSITTTSTTSVTIKEVVNGSFETGDLTGWTVVSGNAFSTQALSSDTTVDGGVPYGKNGVFLLGKTPDSFTGRLQSSTFHIAGSGHITFLLGGGFNQALTYLSIVDASTGLELARYGNHLFQVSNYQTDPLLYRVANLVPYVANLSAHLGKEVYVLLVDDSTRHDGYLTFDHLVTHYPSLSMIPAAYHLAVDIKPVFTSNNETPFQLPNGSFESKTLDHWNVIGESNSFLNSHINAFNRLSNRPNEGSVGVLRSSAFKVGGVGLVSFRLGGTKHSDVTYVVIKQVGTNNTIIKTYSDRWIDSHEENTHLYYVDLSRYMGETFYFEIVDNSRGDWGLVVIEQIQTYYDALPSITDEIAWDYSSQRRLKPTYSVMRSMVNPLIAGINNETERLTFQKTFYATIDGIQNKKGNFPTVLHYKNNGMTFIYTGDIPAMWLRDSSAQVLPYLPFMQVDSDVKLMVKGLLYQQFEQIRRDPYANAFNVDGSIWEHKFEIDSLAYPLWLALHYYNYTQDDSIFDLFFLQSFKRILDTFEQEQNHQDSNYRITNTSDREVGSHFFNPNSRLIWSGYRPSDDVTYYKFFIPGNMFAVAVLEDISALLTSLQIGSTLVVRAQHMAQEVRQAIEIYGVYQHPVYGRIYAFEVTGETADASSTQGKLLMDAANIPSLLSAPWLGYVSKTDPVYLNTRAFILSFDNPYYYEGTYAKGIGDPHDMVGSNNNPHPSVPVPWHMAIAMQALTSTNEIEIRQMVDYMIHTTDGTYVMHEAFNANDPSDYSRDWFTWPCALFAQVYLYQILNFEISR